VPTPARRPPILAEADGRKGVMETKLAVKCAPPDRDPGVKRRPAAFRRA